MHTYDLVVRGASIVDGTGGPEQIGNVAVRDGVIVTVDKLLTCWTRDHDGKRLSVLEAVRNDQPTGALPGRPVRGRREAPAFAQ